MFLIILGVILNLALFVYSFNVMDFFQFIVVVAVAVLAFMLGVEFFDSYGGGLIVGFFVGCAVGNRWM